MGSDSKLPEQKPLAPADSVSYMSIFFPLWVCFSLSLPWDPPPPRPRQRSAKASGGLSVTARKCWSQWGSCQSQRSELSLMSCLCRGLYLLPSLGSADHCLCTLLWSHLQQHHLLYCRASRVVWVLDIYWQVSCGGVAAIRNLAASTVFLE